MKLYEKLNVIQQKLIAPKSQYNSFGKYYYRSCEDILEGLKSVLRETKTALTITDEVVLVGDRYYIKATATLIDCEDGEKISNSALAREEESIKGMSSSQITGASSSYARKYALNGLFCIDDVADADTRNNNDSEPAPAPTKKKAKSKTMNTELLEELVAKCVADDIDISAVCKIYKVDGKDDLEEKYCKNALDNWDKLKQRINGKA